VPAGIGGLPALVRALVPVQPAGGVRTGAGLRAVRAVLPRAGRQRLHEHRAGRASAAERRAELERAARRHLRPVPAVIFVSS
jgi:hypothetical protein